VRGRGWGGGLDRWGQGRDGVGGGWGGWTDRDRSATWSGEAVEEGPAVPTAHSGDTEPRCLMQPGA